MTDIRPLKLSDRPKVGEFLRRYPPEVSELTFTNLFVWRHSRPIFVGEVEDSMAFFTKGGDGSGKAFILGHPLGEASLPDFAEGLREDLAGFIRIPEATARTLEAADLVVAPDRDNSDYVYRVTDLAELEGRRYSKKRNHIKQCLSDYACQYEPLSSSLVSECLDMQDRWCEARQCGHHPGLCKEYIAIREMFDHYEKLQLLGGVIRIDGSVQAYAVGEALRPETAVCHFEKGMPGFQGLGQLVNQWFAKNALQDFQFENREQDLGIPGLRQAKKSYHPAHMVNKFNAWFSPADTDLPLPVEPRECAKHGVDEV